MEQNGEFQSADVGADPRWVRLRPSRIALAITVAAALAALAVILLAPLPLWLRGIFALAWGVASLAEFQLQRLRSASSVLAFRLQERDPAVGGADAPIPVELSLRGRDGVPNRLDGVLGRGGFVSPWFSAFAYRLPGDASWRRLWPRVVPVWPDSVDAETFRRLRVVLKWK